MRLSRPLISGFFVIAALITGILFLVRGCLSKYDERSAMPHLLYFANGERHVILSLVKFEKAISYSQNGGFTNKTVNTDYYIQINDAVTGKKIQKKKIKNHRDIKDHSIEIFGAEGDTAWVYLGEPMAFDPFTLEKIADKAILEEKNPTLKGKFPTERRYYRFDRDTHDLYFTAADGSSWILNMKTLLAEAGEIDPPDSPEAKEVKTLEKLMHLNKEKQDCLYQQKSYRPSRQLSAHEITNKEYDRVTGSYYKERTVLYRAADSLQKLKSAADKKRYLTEDIRRKINSLQENNGSNLSQIKVNADTTDGKWYGLYSRDEMEKLNDRFSLQAAHNEIARRQLFTGTVVTDIYGDIRIAKDGVAIANTAVYFLDGGFLLGKNTGKPIRDEGNFFVIHKDVIGGEGKIQLSRMSADGKLSWTFNTQLKQWADYVYTGKQLFISGTDNKKLSSGDCNVLWCIDLATGKAEKYDFFTDK